MGPLLARALAVSAGYHLDVFDFRGNETIAGEARELARSVDFPPTLVSAGIDLLLNFARCHEVGRAEGLLADVVGIVEKAAGWHGWIWRLRLAEVRAELALAREDFDEAIRCATDAIELNRGKKIKYEATGLGTRAKALHALGRTREAISDLRRAVQLVRPTGDPAMFLRAAVELLVIDGDDALAAEFGDHRPDCTGAAQRGHASTLRVIRCGLRGQEAHRPSPTRASRSAHGVRPPTGHFDCPRRRRKGRQEAPRRGLAGAKSLRLATSIGGP